MEEEVVTILVTEYETTYFETEPNTITTILPEDSVLSPRDILIIAIISLTAILFLVAIATVITMAIRNKRKTKVNRDDGPIHLSSTNEMTPDNNEPKPEEHAWAYSNDGMDVTGDEGIEADLDPKTEDHMKHLAATFEAGPSLGLYQPGEKRANFDRQSFIAEQEDQDNQDGPIYGNIDVGPSNERRPSTFTFFSGDLPTTPL